MTPLQDPEAALLSLAKELSEICKISVGKDFIPLTGFHRTNRISSHSSHLPLALGQLQLWNGPTSPAPGPSWCCCPAHLLSSDMPGAPNTEMQECCGEQPHSLLWDPSCRGKCSIQGMSWGVAASGFPQDGKGQPCRSPWAAQNHGDWVSAQPGGGLLGY